MSPTAKIRSSPRLGSGVNMMVSSGPQLAPRVTGGTSVRVWGAPPEMDTFFNLVPTINATDCPSGEKKGPWPPSVPGIGVAYNRAIRRR